MSDLSQRGCAENAHPLWLCLMQIVDYIPPQYTRNALHGVSTRIATGIISSCFHVIIIDTSSGFLHLRLQLTESPANANADITIRRFAFRPRAESIGQRFAAIGLVFLEYIAGTDRNIQSVFFQERTAKSDSIKIIRRAFALQ